MGGSRSGCAAAPWLLRAPTVARSAGKCRYTVSRCTPARSAIALIVLRRGPSSRCRSTVASTIRCRVAAWLSARCLSSYFLAIDSVNDVGYLI